ncbi:MAG TPA: phage holin family protein [Candidatus Moranbacteria bacterium]|jgi:putative membrane protein|nr:phage holin family protein [Candidatus Moranbacteria bacterium]HRY27953.1 phage holin family protein [Candidatus Moranbacteria bacterium]HSA08231.1 phage holin family protein [Candidatus Moranbacteria bacterium]
MRIIIHWFLSALAIIITAYLLPTEAIYVKSFFVALVVAVVLGLLNSVIRPILIILTLPLEIMTLGLFTFVINAGLVLLTSNIVAGFHVKSFWWALVFSLVLSLISGVLHLFEPSKKHHHGTE